MALRLEVPSLRLLWAREAAGHPVPSTLSPSTPAPCTLQPSPRVQFDRPPLHRQGPAQTPSMGHQAGGAEKSRPMEAVQGREPRVEQADLHVALSAQWRAQPGPELATGGRPSPLCAAAD
ncbi:hypothetical protein J4Q44_G00090430 [Coregonus suidteri]|uniref:Uncharacterized protein n=1 Tax=Coregonus suidteri TaxID=861788 RepID=A0AAN8MVF8_9TELE